jgi:hypothetical protein
LKVEQRDQHRYYICPSYPGGCSYGEGIETIKTVPLAQALFLFGSPYNVSYDSEVSFEKPDKLIPQNHEITWTRFPHELPCPMKQSVVQVTSNPH